jgi:D-alanyl-D-alanine carboxypeptidase
VTATDRKLHLALRTAPRVPFAAIALALGLVVAACGSSISTATPVPSAAPTASPTSSATVYPSVSIYPVPTSQYATPGTLLSLNSTLSANLQQALNSLRNSYGYPGAAAAIVFPDGSVWSGQTGYAIKSSSTAVTADTLFSIGSISKTFVAALLCRLTLRGTVGLDDPLSKYVPSFANAANISVRQLLNHTSGVRDLFDTFGNALGADTSRVWTADEILAGLGAPYFAPGTGYHYSNTDFVLLGMVIEKATGKTVAEQVRSEFLVPMGLAHTFYQLTETVGFAEAHGYTGTASKPTDDSAGQKYIPFVSEVTAVGPAGAYVSNATDVARWGAALYGGSVLDLATLASMADLSASLPYKPALPYGLGFEQTSVNGQIAWGHRGHLDGFWSSMWYLPGANISVAILTNADWINPITAATALVRAVQS